jgi:hypothetical protein
MSSFWEKARNILHLYADLHLRTPVVIFLSDGEDDVTDDPIYDICRSAVRQGFVDL